VFLISEFSFSDDTFIIYEFLSAKSVEKGVEVSEMVARIYHITRRHIPVLM
jgi:hypothetical protein